MSTYAIIDLVLKLVAAGINGQMLLEKVAAREQAGESAEQIYRFLSDTADMVLAKQ